jgi:hypothetical protein
MNHHEYPPDGEPPLEVCPHHGHRDGEDDEMVDADGQSRIEQPNLEEVEVADTHKGEHENEERYEHDMDHGDRRAISIIVEDTDD